MRQETVLLEAKFDPKLKTYWFLSSLWVMAISILGIPIIPFWLFGLGQYICARRYEHQKASLTTRTLHIRSGHLFKVEKHIPLDVIQDLTLREGPILRKMGLVLLTVETAGQSQQGQPDAALSGLVDAAAFRDAVLDQKDKLASVGQPESPAPAQPPSAERQDEVELLTEIRDTLKRIEEKLDNS